MIKLKSLVGVPMRTEFADAQELAQWAMELCNGLATAVNLSGDSDEVNLNADATEGPFPRIWVEFESPVQEAQLTDEGVDLEPEPHMEFVFEGFAPHAKPADLQKYVDGLNAAHPGLNFRLEVR